MSKVDEVLICLFCMLVVAFLTGIETGVVALHRMRLRHLIRKGDQSARILQGYLDDSDRLFGTTLVGTNLGIVIISVLATSMVDGIPGVWAKAVASAIVAVLLLVFAEYLPKAWFYSKPMERSRRFSRLLQFAELVFRPIAVSVVWMTKLLVPGAPESFSKPAPFITKDELKMLVREGEKHGVISSSKGMMIHRVLELSGRMAKQIMVRRDKMVIATTDMTVPEFMDVARSSRHTRLPVFDKEKKDFVGIINSFFLASSDPASDPKTVAGFIRKPLYVFENTPIAEILPLLRRSRHPMCLVVNDKSEVTGLISAEDIVREIVGTSHTA
jgi:CBS domain containing-hemolysin-like protein